MLGFSLNLAASTARLFLGVRLECAQCHDHPFARWKRSQFWEMAAFFANVQPRIESIPRPRVFAPLRSALQAPTQPDPPAASP